MSFETILGHLFINILNKFKSLKEVINMKTLNKVKMSIWINALSAIAIGILFLINPQESFEVVTIIAGIIITATGIIDFIYYLNGWLDISFMKNTLLSGFLKCTLGIFVLTHIPLMTTFFSYIFSLYIIISALYCLEVYTFMKSMITSSITFDYFIVTILIFTGLVMFFLAPSTVISSSFVIGILFLVNGIGNLLIALRLTKLTKQYRNYLQ